MLPAPLLLHRFPNEDFHRAKLLLHRFPNGDFHRVERRKDQEGELVAQTPLAVDRSASK